MSGGSQGVWGRTALLLVDLQNDFLHADGAYGRAGQSMPEIAALPDRLAPLADAVRVGVYLHDMATFDEMNDIYLETFPEPLPAP